MERRALIRKAIEIGNRTGSITFNQLNELCKDKIDPEDIEAVMEALSKAEIHVIEDE